MRTTNLALCKLLSATLLVACSAAERREPFGGGTASEDVEDPPAESSPSPIEPSEPGDGEEPDVVVKECVGASARATLAPLPTDIVWVVDNSSSMQDEINAVRAGINAFADQLSNSGLDYHLVMLSKRGTTATSELSPICVPVPLAGPDCSDSARFVHSNFAGDGIRSVQPLEQLLGSLAQTAGYQPGDARGGTPWAQHLRPEASKALVVVSDDNSRLSSYAFLHTPGGTTQQVSGGSASCVLPPGLFHPYWQGMFDSLVVHAMVGPSGATYRELAQQTGGVTANIAEAGGASSPSWNAFFDAVATQVVASTPAACAVPIPAPPAGQTLDPARVNVSVTSPYEADGVHELGRVASAAACGAQGGWYYDDAQAPQRVELCPASCAEMNAIVDADQRKVDVIFGCESVTVVN